MMPIRIPQKRQPVEKLMISKNAFIFFVLLKVPGSSFFFLLELSDPTIKLLNVVMSAKLIKYFGKSYILCVKNA